LCRLKVSLAIMLCVSYGSAAYSDEPSKTDYLSFAERSWKHFRCGYLHEAAMGHNITGIQFTRRGFELGKQFFDAVKDGKINQMDFTLKTPRDFWVGITELSPEFDLGRASIIAKHQIAGEILAFNESLPATLNDIKDSSFQIDNEQTASNAIERIKTENCDYDDLGFSAEITKSMRENALRGPMLLNNGKPPRKE
jgi:hypothetical protein